MLLIRRPGKCRKLFMGKHPWKIDVYESVTGEEGPGVAAVAILAKTGQLRDLVPATFALLGARVRLGSFGWVNGDSPALPTESDLADHWRQAIAKPLATMDIDAFSNTLTHILDNVRSVPFELRKTPRGQLVVNGERIAATSVSLPLAPPWQNAVRLGNAWNDVIVVGESSTQLVLGHWLTTA